MPTLRKTRRTTQAALTLGIQTSLRPLERLARYLNGDDPLLTDQAFLLNPTKPRGPATRSIMATPEFREVRREADRRLAEELGGFVRQVQCVPYPECSRETTRQFEHWTSRGPRGVGDALWAMTLAEFVGNPYRDRLRRCENPRCRRWFVDATRNHSKECCERACTIKVSNAKLTVERLKARRKARRAQRRTQGAR
jgi:hypothetical protein